MDSSLERAFDARWIQLAPEGTDVPISQCYFDLDRLWRFDRAVISKLVAIELHGGGFVGGRHNREAGMSDDFEKHNAASAAGWRVFYLTTSMLTNDPVKFFQPIFDLLNKPVLSPDSEFEMWKARIRNLMHVGDTVTNNGITVERRKQNTFYLSFSSGGFTVGGKHMTIQEAQMDTIDLILRGVSKAATPSPIHQSKRQVAAVRALF